MDWKIVLNLATFVAALIVQPVTARSNLAFVPSLSVRQSTQQSSLQQHQQPVREEGGYCSRRRCCHRRRRLSPLAASDWRDTSNDSNQWRSEQDFQQERDWLDEMTAKNDGSFWTSFESATDDTSTKASSSTTTNNNVKQSSSSTSEDQDTEAWLDTLQLLAAEEIQFNLKEADRADKVRQMQEWGFGSETIANTLGVAVDSQLERADEVTGMQQYRVESYLDDVDLSTVESHTKVETDPDTGEPFRSQMVYVDEHTCIGCTNCAMTAQSTFFMHPEHGRARVFQQWGDTDETIQIAIETCPVDCIHYVPYDELVKLEVDRRNQNINFKARLVSQAEFGSAPSHRVGGGSFTAPQRISGNMKARCSNCPSRGCYDCPMYGVGKNPEYEKKEKARKERMAKRKLQEQREREQKSAEL